MYSKEALCEKIIELYPEIGKCGIEISVEHDSKKKIWLLISKKESMN